LIAIEKGGTDLISYCTDNLAQGSAKRFEKPDWIELDRIADFENVIGSNLIGSQILKT
jgi:hypothetical protein